ncbi:PAP2 family protein [Vibrio sp. T187]|uniref:phosphatase PAP2 family protein n=1 Tax=Vibrio TaxID=662 RepID=UPI0010C994F9|nr:MULTISPECIES: phosphatase PAP2 family protein [Vibrio]MBW3694255.1 PAP2 family protein [Vibrio sp. T187]
MPKTEWGEVWQKMQSEVKRESLLYSFIFVSSLFVFVISKVFFAEIHIDYNLFLYLKVLLETCYVTLTAWCVYYYFYLLVRRHPHPMRQFYAKVKSFVFPPYRLFGCLLLLLALNLTFSCYTYIKALIPNIHYFSWDVSFYQLDKMLHFGVSPWEITHAIFSTPWSSFVINFLYHLWFFIMWGTVLVFIFNKNLSHLRTQFLLSFLSSWLITGGVFAVLLSSAGPCYLHLISPDFTYYQPLLDRLNAQSNELVADGFLPLWVLGVQDMLWQSYLENTGGTWAGISAMPSMHVAIAVLMALSLSKVNRYLGYVMWLFAIIIQIGSVHLAWHYAVDGYMSFILTCIIWFACGRLARLQPTMPLAEQAAQKE